MTWKHLLRYRLIVILLLILSILVLFQVAESVRRSAPQSTPNSTARCLPADPDRDHFFPPVDEAPLPSDSNTGPEQAPLTWIGFTKPMSIDFTRALLRGTEEQARQFIAPEVTIDIANLRDHLGIGCPADTYTVHRKWVADDEVIMVPTVYYAQHTVKFQIVLRLYPDRWWITAVEPLPAVQPSP